jgi:hypothetical protein
MLGNTTQNPTLQHYNDTDDGERAFFAEDLPMSQGHHGNPQGNTPPSLPSSDGADFAATLVHHPQDSGGGNGDHQHHHHNDDAGQTGGRRGGAGGNGDGQSGVSTGATTIGPDGQPLTWGAKEEAWTIHFCKRVVLTCNMHAHAARISARWDRLVHIASTILSGSTSISGVINVVFGDRVVNIIMVILSAAAGILTVLGRNSGWQAATVAHQSATVELDKLRNHMESTVAQPRNTRSPFPGFCAGVMERWSKVLEHAPVLQISTIKKVMQAHARSHATANFDVPQAIDQGERMAQAQEMRALPDFAVTMFSSSAMHMPTFGGGGAHGGGGGVVANGASTRRKAKAMEKLERQQTMSSMLSVAMREQFAGGATAPLQSDVPMHAQDHPGVI